MVFDLNNDSKGETKHVVIVDHVSGKDTYVYAHSSNNYNEKCSYTLADTILCHFDGTILTDNSIESGNTSSWEAQYGTETLKPSNIFNTFVQKI